jgi:hypothetical protein
VGPIRYTITHTLVSRERRGEGETDFVAESFGHLVSSVFRRWFEIDGSDLSGRGEWETCVSIVS